MSGRRYWTVKQVRHQDVAEGDTIRWNAGSEWMTAGSNFSVYNDDLGLVEIQVPEPGPAVGRDWLSRLEFWQDHPPTSGIGQKGSPADFERCECGHTRTYHRGPFSAPCSSISVPEGLISCSCHAWRGTGSYDLPRPG